MNHRYTFILALGISGNVFGQAPENDLCTEATLLQLVGAAGCPAAAVQGTTADANGDGATPTCDGGAAIQDVWYRFNTTGFENPFSLQLEAGSATHYAVQVFSGDCDGAQLGCFGGSPAFISLPALQAGSDHLIRVFTNTDLGAPGTFSLCVSGVAGNSACGTTVYDNGGPGGNYSLGLLPYEEVFTYCPDNGAVQAINLAFTEFNTRSSDNVRIYNGPDINSPLMGNFSGNLNGSLPGPFQSTHPSGCITLRFNYNSFLANAAGWAAQLTCCSLPLVLAEPTSNGPVCEGATLQLQAGTDQGTSYAWTGPNGFTSTEQDPIIPDFGPANVGQYTVVVGTGIPGCSVNPASLLVTVVQPPSTLEASSNVAQLCGPGTVDLSALANTTVVALDEGFEGFPAAGWGTSGSGVTAATNEEYFLEGQRSVRLTHGTDANGHYGTTTSINLAGISDPVLRFSHICALEQGFDYGFVDISVNGGASWSPLPATTYLGANNANFTGGNVRFSRNSFAGWQSQFAGAASTPGAGPATALWQTEEFDLSAYATSTDLRIRFRITSDFSINYYGWLIDQVSIGGEAGVTYAWSADPAGFESTEQAPAGIAVENSTTYTVTASTGAGCSISEQVFVEVLGAEPVIIGPAAITRCAGIPFDLSAEALGGEPPFTYVWSNGGTVVGAGPDLIGLILTTSATVQLTVTDASGCARSTEVEVTIGPPPNVTLAAQDDACVDWEPFALEGGSPAGGTYLVNGVPTTFFDPGAGPGVYTVVYSFTDANGCTATAQRPLLVEACTGVEELDAFGLTMYPNPATNVLHVTADMGRFDIHLLDAAGRLVHSEGLDVSNDRERVIALDRFVNGMYSVVITTDDGQRWTKRLVIAR